MLRQGQQDVALTTWPQHAENCHLDSERRGSEGGGEDRVVGGGASAGNVETARSWLETGSILEEQQQAVSFYAVSLPSQAIPQEGRSATATPGQWGSTRSPFHIGLGGSPLYWQSQESLAHNLPAGGPELNRAGAAANSVQNLHEMNRCKPCLYLYAGHCRKGDNCLFCHRPHEDWQIKSIKPSDETRKRLRLIAQGWHRRGQEQQREEGGELVFGIPFPGFIKGSSRCRRGDEKREGSGWHRRGQEQRREEGGELVFGIAFPGFIKAGSFGAMGSTDMMAPFAPIVSL